MSYSSGVLDHFHNPRNVGEVDGPDAVGQAGVPGQGNFMLIQLRVAMGVVRQARYRTYGCPTAIACGSVLTEMITRKTVKDASELAASDIVDALGGLPLGKQHCAELAVSALHCALRILP